MNLSRQSQDGYEESLVCATKCVGSRLVVDLCSFALCVRFSVGCMMADETTTSCLRGAGIERSCPTATLVILARHIVAFYFAIAAHVASPS